MKSWRTRSKASLILTPAILLLLVWIGTFAGVEAVANMGLMRFMLSASVASIVIAYCVTLYLDFMTSRSK
jgi:hypothetical protein